MTDQVKVSEFAVNGLRLVVVSAPLTPLQHGTLTKTELEIARRVIRGESVAQIAQARARSPVTVSNQIASLYAKLGVHNRRELSAALSHTSLAEESGR
ncbi:MAG: helix-turn-helix transcriptional regulator [Polyangiaceae bacterium]